MVVEHEVVPPDSDAIMVVFSALLVEVQDMSSKNQAVVVPTTRVSRTRTKTFVKDKAPRLTVYCTYVVDIVPEYGIPLAVQVTLSGEVSTTKPCEALVLFLRYQKEKTPGVAIDGVLIISPAPLKFNWLAPVRGLLEAKPIEVCAQVPPCVGRDDGKLSNTWKAEHCAER